MKKVDNPYTCPSHCKDSHTLHIKIAANLTQIHNFKANFHKVFELFSKKNYANNGGHMGACRNFCRGGGGGQAQKGPP